MNKFWTVLMHTYLSRVKTKSFVISTIITLLFIMAFLNIDKIIAMFDSDEVKQVAVIDETGELFEPISNELIHLSDEVEVSEFTGDVETAEEQIHAEEIAGLFTVSLNERGLPEGVLKAENTTDERWIQPLEQALQQVKVFIATEQLNLDPEQVAGINEPVELERIALAEGAKTEEEVAQSIVIVYILTFLIYMAVLIYGMMIATEVATEKSSRVMEILISSVSPITQMFGKIFGIALLGISQIALIFIIGFLSIQSAADSQDSIVSLLQLDQIPISIIVYAVVFFLLGFLLYATLLAMLGSLVSRVEDVNQVVTPVTLLIVAAFMTTMFGMNAPESMFVTVMSFVPFFTPMLMLLRIGMLQVPMWEVALGIGILAGTVLLFAVLGARIYQGGVLMYGKSSLKDIRRAIALTKK